ncbi:MAG: hypothetical protein XD87_0236 [candidate division WS6 bacterium 36_33]|uniref:Uncharacterized protein n=1 Tax=candidate division WS6 bacterium 36_33 TaxID=1641388 RepID=A0A117LTX2_9BACT|nr:MAG: hypothetical protein XD87_0236 [candidate division WS6 bacterium 36_33]
MIRNRKQHIITENPLGQLPASAHFCDETATTRHFTKHNLLDSHNTGALQQ